MEIYFVYLFVECWILKILMESIILIISLFDSKGKGKTDLFFHSLLYFIPSSLLFRVVISIYSLIFAVLIRQSIGRKMNNYNQLIPSNIEVHNKTHKKPSLNTTRYESIFLVLTPLVKHNLFQLLFEASIALLIQTWHRRFVYQTIQGNS